MYRNVVCVGLAAAMSAVSCNSDDAAGVEGATSSAMTPLTTTQAGDSPSDTTTSEPQPDDTSPTGMSGTNAGPSTSEGAPLPDPVVDPILPAVDGPCPQFVSGEQSFAGLTIRIEAGDASDGPGPLLFYFHGTGSSLNEIDRLLPAAQANKIVAQGGIIVSPQSDESNRGGYSPNGVWYEGDDSSEGDLEWIDQVVACAAEQHNIDPLRIYTTGCSAGGLMAAGVALRRSTYVAATAPNSGGVLPNGAGAVQDDMRVPAVFSMHGGEDDTVIVNFEQTSARLNNLIVDAGGFALDCNHMSGHCTAPEAVRTAAWTFLKDHRFGLEASPYTAGIPEEFPDYCEVWSR